MKRALIISGGEYSPIDSISYDVCIACDKGADYAKRMNIVPDYIIGDFDSLSDFNFDSFSKDKVITFPERKDDTDTLLAIKHGISIGCTHFTIVCALGNRLDHTIANIQTLHFITKQGCFGEIISENEHMITISDINPLVINQRPDFSLSLFALTDECNGLTIKGSDYDVENITLTNAFPLGISNKFSKPSVEITIKSGILLIVLSRIK